MSAPALRRLAGRALRHAASGLKQAVALCSVWVLCVGAANANDYNGWWWNPDQSGQGINIGHQGNQVFIAWFTYDETGKGAWLVMGGPLSTPTTLSGPLYRTTGPALGTTFDPNQVKETQVGTGTLTFSDLHHASFAWTFNGHSGTLALIRESYAATTVAGTYSASYNAASKTTATAACGYTGSAVAVPTSFTIAMDATNMTINQSSFPAASYQGAVQQSGEWLYVPSGTYTSSDTYGNGTFTASALAIGRLTLVELALSPSAHPGCVITRYLTGSH